MPATAPKDSHPQNIIHFPVGVETGKLQPATPDHNTETLSIAAPPPVNRTLREEASLWFTSRLWFYVVELPIITLLHILFYVALFTVPFFVSYIWKPWNSWWWKTYVPDLSSLNSLDVQLPTDLLRAEPIVAGIVLLVAMFYALNRYDLFWRVHFGEGKPGPLVVPLWMRYQRQHSNFEKLLRVGGSSLHFGLLSVWYGFNKEAFFVRAQGDHAAMVINYSLIRDIRIDRAAPEGWYGNFDTPPVLIQFDAGRPTSLRIHGAYFEQGRNGIARASAFVAAFKAAKAASDGVPM